MIIQMASVRNNIQILIISKLHNPSIHNRTNVFGSTIMGRKKIFGVHQRIKASFKKILIE